MFFARVAIPVREDIEPSPYVKPIKKVSSKINISKIYENDLFDTYQKELPPLTMPNYATPVPQPPQPLPVLIPEEPKPTFLEPLPITLKGIIIVVNDDSKNRVLIADNKTGRESSYRLGDKIEDAQLIRILSNKVMFLRSNGQQEVLYLREKDAKLDPAFASQAGWDLVVQAITPSRYIINMGEFAQRVPNLAIFIELLDLITVYKQGTSVGCRVGNVQPDSLATALGLHRADIIQSINEIPTTNTQDRLSIYKEILVAQPNDNIYVDILRSGQPIRFTYTLHNQQTKKSLDINEAKKTNEAIVQEQIKRLEQKHTLAPTLQDLRNRERKNMLEKAQRPTQNILSNLTE
jgi:type II secretory pathway component PulC